jgi:hypothetical protein
MIKTFDTRTTAAAQQPACYVESDAPSLGIAFCRKDGTQRFAPYSFLSSVDFNGHGELVFRFDTWSASVRGEALQPLWKALREGCLAQVNELDRPSIGGEPSVFKLIFVDAEPDFAGPAFPARP